MSNENGSVPTNQYPDLPPISATDLDPTTWAEVKQTFPVVVESSKLRYSDEKYGQARQFNDGTLRPALPRPVKQWDFRLKRLDARIHLLNGTFAPAIQYAGFDLEKFTKSKQGDWSIKSITQLRSKELVLIEEWMKISGGPIVPPERLEGMKFIVEKYLEKDVTGKGRRASNVIIPIELLDPTFEYTGEIETFEQRRPDEVDANAVAGSTAFAGATAVSNEQAAQSLGEFIKANNIVDFGPAVLGHPNYPPEAMNDPFVTAIAEGREATEKVLAENGVSI